MERYRKIELKGKGSYGQAILVQNKQDRKFYIMKIIDASKFDIKEKENALNEIDVLKNLHHPCIIEYRESFVDKNKYLCIVMDYAEEGTLHQRLEQQKQKQEYLKENQIIEWFTQICLAVKYIHDRRIIHRDIKTQNIFISKGEIKLGDFGIAKSLINSEDLCQTAIGTPYYISPEVCQRIPYDYKSDIWSLGCMLYEMMALKHAFEAKTMEGLFLKIINGKYQPMPINYSQELIQLLKDILNTDPQKRLNINQILDYRIIRKSKNEFVQRKTQNLQKIQFISGQVKKIESLSGRIRHYESEQKEYGESLADLIEKMRMELEEQLGVEKFIIIYNSLKNEEDSSKFSNEIIIDKITQLLQLEQLIF
ncbi:unnamed protein product (macronuclear) [Paramecium tetraurelia]|uniref:non-specific serine/threonine protein kinase n=1 Tax=Paramecium tetraurelia TaxID=5888 RepID=A0D9J8_PARTE|nr:uncharacterized protein GSPATT00014645001 [Paramecium tetraurelia]CAK79715.1 unnamed protein product [Paramecium tetraurelia]|eukprot:XP_001447112.1 hypothetical protein (macronuclear) [Paramecium tetraurelia strain d4-2]